MTSDVHFILNGEPVSVTVRPDATVLDILRNELRQKGTKEGCAEGDCGACTVLLRRAGTNGGKRMAANSCIMTAAQIDGAEITTVEGVKNEGMLSTLQAAMAANGASQCGFCTPGIVMAATGLIENNPAPSESDIHDALAGNLCRCTGYKPIVEAIKASVGSIHVAQASRPSKLAQTIEHAGAHAHMPRSLQELLSLKNKHPEAVILAGGTDLGVARAAYETDWSATITTNHVAELRRCETGESHFVFGAAVTWQEMLEAIASDYPSFATLIRRFGSTQIRSMGTLGGNIGTASPIGDGPPSLIALGAQITLASFAGGERTIKLEDFFLDYRKTAMQPDEVIVSVTVPRKADNQHFRVWKVSKRYDQDISTVCGAFNLLLDGDTIVEATIAYGGMAAIPKRAKNAEQCLIGKQVSPAAFAAAAKAIADDYAPLSDWRGSADYRAHIAAGLVQRLAHDLEGLRVEVMA